MRVGGIDSGAGKARLLLETQILQSQGRLVGHVDAAITTAFSLLVVPLAFDPRVPFSVTVPWGLLIGVCCFGRMAQLRLDGPWARGFTAARCVCWSAVPWLVWPVLDSTDMALVVMGIGGYGVAIGAIVLPQISTSHRYAPLLGVVVASYVAALGASEYWIQAFGLLSVSIHVAFGIWGFETIKKRLFGNQVALAEEAFRDQLTGLGSRGAAINEIERRIAANQPVHCVVADIDDFKSINTHLGHHGGDAALIAVADALSTTLKRWYVARLGGDEFVAINKRGLHPSEEGMITTINVGSVGAGPGSRVLSLSLGASSIEPGSGSPDQLLSEASAALRRAKGLGKQCLVVADDELRREELSRQSLAAEARSGLESNEIIAWGQPIFSVDTGRPVGVELLARWYQNDGRVVMPGRFVPVIEAQGLAPVLADLMGRNAIEVLKELDRIGDHTSFVSFNLSALVLLDADLPGRLTDRLAEAGVDPSRLVVEVTESQQLPQTATLGSAVARLRVAGVGIAIDDLGAGQSSLNRMMDTPFTHIKLDRILTTTSARPGAEELLGALGKLAVGAGQVLIAEGVETNEDLERVRRVGLDLVQGYLLARPEPLNDVLHRFTEALAPAEALAQTEIDATDTALEGLSESATGPETLDHAIVDSTILEAEVVSMISLEGAEAR